MMVSLSSVEGRECVAWVRCSFAVQALLYLYVTCTVTHMACRELAGSQCFRKPF